MGSLGVVLSGLVFGGLGLWLGLFLRRAAQATAVSDARRAAEAEVASLREQVRGREEAARVLAEQLAAMEAKQAATAAELLRASSSAASHAASLEAAGREAQQLRARLAEEEERGQKAALALAERQQEGARLHSELDAARTQLEEARREVERLAAEGAALDDELRGLAERRATLEAQLDAEQQAGRTRLAESERANTLVRTEVEALAHRILDEKGKAILQGSHEGLEALLKPVRERLKEFEEKVDKTYDQENRDRASLLTHLKQLQDSQTRLHKDAESLARALTGDSKTQGDWGEIMLERLLETAGLTEGREYELQVNHVADDGSHKRPDALIYLPGDRAVVVDAKCSLKAFVEAVRAESPESRELALDAHVASLRGHVKGLASKNYQDVLRQRTLDIVLLFVPNEAAFHAGISRELTLYDEAFRQGVVICSPTTLLAALQLMAHVWRSEKQNHNAVKIAEEAGKLLDKLGAFVKDLDDVGTRLTQAQESFAAARNKLASGRGNALTLARGMAKLGARAKSEKGQALLLEGDDEGELAEALPLLGAPPPRPE